MFNERVNVCKYLFIYDHRPTLCPRNSPRKTANVEAIQNCHGTYRLIRCSYYYYFYYYYYYYIIYIQMTLNMRLNKPIQVLETIYKKSYDTCTLSAC